VSLKGGTLPVRTASRFQRDVHDLDHQTEIVAADVEHGPAPDRVGVREVASHVHDVLHIRLVPTANHCCTYR
jgi:hypothetical protein